MPRTARAIEANLLCHVLNRGNGGLRLFEEPAEYSDFEQIMAEGLQRYPVDSSFAAPARAHDKAIEPGPEETAERIVQ